MSAGRRARRAGGLFWEPRTRVGHRELADGRVVELEALILEDAAIDALAAGAVTVSDVATLTHELWDYPVELGALQVQLLACSRMRGGVVARGEGAGGIVQVGLVECLRLQLPSRRCRGRGNFLLFSARPRQTGRRPCGPQATLRLRPQ